MITPKSDKPWGAMSRNEQEAFYKSLRQAVRSESEERQREAREKLKAERENRHREAMGNRKAMVGRGSIGSWGGHDAWSWAGRR